MSTTRLYPRDVMAGDVLRIPLQGGAEEWATVIDVRPVSPRTMELVAVGTTQVWDHRVSRSAKVTVRRHVQRT